MRRKRMLILPLTIGLLLLTSYAQTTQAAVEGKTYYFATSASDTYEENGVPLYTTETDAWFKIKALNVSTDVLYYEFEGYHWSEGAEVEYQSEAIHFQDNLVHFHLSIYDPDNDSYSAPPSIAVEPTDAHHTPGRYVFVNPTYETHDSGWDGSVSDVEDEASVQQSTFNAPGDGTFSFTIIVDIEDIWYIDDDSENATGTRKFDFSASYDTDGVLNTLLLTTTTSLSNENFTSKFTRVWSVSRTSGPSIGGAMVLDTTLLAVGIAVPVSILIGLLIGRKLWGGL